MRNFLIKFNYGVEIGAHLAYMGHYKVTGDKNIRRIAREELIHRMNLRRILKRMDDKPSVIINTCFKIIGYTIQKLCYISPKPLLNFVARSMEVFAIFSYGLCADYYPEYATTFELMAIVEEEHRDYFRGV